MTKCLYTDTAHWFYSIHTWLNYHLGVTDKNCLNDVMSSAPLHETLEVACKKPEQSPPPVAFSFRFEIAGQKERDQTTFPNKAEILVSNLTLNMKLRLCILVSEEGLDVVIMQGVL